MKGWIKLHRKIIDSPMYKSLNPKQRDVMIQLLLMANHEENEWMWQGEIYKCKPGQIVTSLQSIADNCALLVKVQSVRTALLKLVKWGFLTDKSTKTGRLITIKKWRTYQADLETANKAPSRQLTKHQQRANKDLTTNKKDKNVKKKKRFIPPTFDELKEHLKTKNIFNDDLINNFINHYEGNGWKIGHNKMVSWKHTISNWCNREGIVSKLTGYCHNEDCHSHNQDRTMYKETDKCVYCGKSLKERKA